MLINSKETLESCALHHGLLPFFHNPIRGFSVAEMTAPGFLFGGNSDDEGCWEWKGPVLRGKTTAYGKFFRRKAGFVSLDLLPDFLNYRRSAYPVKPASTEEMILDIIRENEGLSSTELKMFIFGFPKRMRKAWDIPDNETVAVVRKRSSIETQLQKLQMGGWLLISDFEYKLTSRGEKYGWGVARYSTPELWFGRDFLPIDRTPQESLEILVEKVSKKLSGKDRESIRQLIL